MKGLYDDAIHARFIELVADLRRYSLGPVVGRGDMKTTVIERTEEEFHAWHLDKQMPNHGLCAICAMTPLERLCAAIQADGKPCISCTTISRPTMSLQFQCPKCGTNNGVGSKYCGSCGTPLVAPTPVVSPPPWGTTRPPLPGAVGGAPVAATDATPGVGTKGHLKASGRKFEVTFVSCNGLDITFKDRGDKTTITVDELNKNAVIDQLVDGSPSDEEDPVPNGFFGMGILTSLADPTTYRTK